MKTSEKLCEHFSSVLMICRMFYSISSSRKAEMKMFMFRAYMKCVKKHLTLLNAFPDMKYPTKQKEKPLKSDSRVQVVKFYTLEKVNLKGGLSTCPWPHTEGISNTELFMSYGEMFNR